MQSAEDMDTEPCAHDEASGTIRFIDQSDYKVDEDGSILLSVKLDKDQVECCVCYQPMNGTIFRCRSNNSRVHNVCFNCEWQIRRMKETNGHVKAQRCPLCKELGSFVRNRALEKQLHDLSRPCKNSSKGCQERFFAWNEEERELHESNCMCNDVVCPLCSKKLDGVGSFMDHINSECSLGPFTPLTSREYRKQSLIEMPTHQNLFYWNKSQQYVLLYVWRGSFFEIVALNLRSNPHPMCNYQIHLKLTKKEDLEQYQIAMKSENYVEHLKVPQSQVLTINLQKFESDLNRESAYFFVGPDTGPTVFMCRYFSLQDSLTQGCTLDCRDFFGKWYEAEVLKVLKENPYVGNNEATAHTRLQVHYLGYSSSYDEWFDLATDTSRIAFAGTHTVGPNLRTVRRSAHQVFDPAADPRRTHRRRVIGSNVSSSVQMNSHMALQALQESRAGE